MNQYETVFILTPILSEEQTKEAVERIKGVLAGAGAEVFSEEMWGMRKLAYPIEKKSTGFYCMLEFNAEPTVIKNYELQLRRDEQVLRYITVKNEKYAAQYAEKRRLKNQQKKED